MNKKILIKRLKLLLALGRVIEVPIELLYNKKAWEKDHKKNEIFDGIMEKHPPDELFNRLQEWDKKPHSYFGIRPGFTARVEAYAGDSITPRDLSGLFEEGDELTLGPFKPLGSTDDFFSKLNRWYYGSMGQRAFTWEGKVPIKLPNDPLIQKANARNLHQRVVQGDFGKKGSIIVQKWGSGGLLDPVESFLDEMVRLDEQNRTHVYGRLRYVLSDISDKCIRESRDQAKDEKDDRPAKRHLDAGALKFKIIDATSAPPTGDTKVASIESSYLYDSVSQPIIAKVDGRFYEVHYRAYVDNSPGNDFQKSDYQRIHPLKFKRLLIEGDLKKLSYLRPTTFGNIRWEEKLVEIPDIMQYPHGRILEQMTGGVDNITLPTSITILESIKNAAESLRPRGYIQTFDLGIRERGKIVRQSGDIHQYNGSVYSGVNFELIVKTLTDQGFDVKVEHLTDYLEEVLGEKVLPTITLPSCARDTHAFDTYFPLHLMRKSTWIQQTADRIKKKFGYSDQGRNAFYLAMCEAGLTEWCIHDIFDRDRYRKEDYVADLRESLRSTMFYRAFEGGPMWIFQRSPNEEMRKKFEFLGFKDEIVPHLIKQHGEISSWLNYYHLFVQKVNGGKGFNVPKPY